MDTNEAIVWLIRENGMTDGEHHKQWLLDQILHEILSEEEYEDFIRDRRGNMWWDAGIAP